MPQTTVEALASTVLDSLDAPRRCVYTQLKRFAYGLSRMFNTLEATVGPNGAFHRPNMTNGGIPAPPPTYVPPVGSSFNT